ARHQRPDPASSRARGSPAATSAAFAPLRTTAEAPSGVLRAATVSAKSDGGYGSARPSRKTRTPGRPTAIPHQAKSEQKRRTPSASRATYETALYGSG